MHLPPSINEGSSSPAYITHAGFLAAASVDTGIPTLGVPCSSDCVVHLQLQQIWNRETKGLIGLAIDDQFPIPGFRDFLIAWLIQIHDLREIPRSNPVYSALVDPLC